MILSFFLTRNDLRQMFLLVSMVVGPAEELKQKISLIMQKGTILLRFVLRKLSAISWNLLQDFVKLQINAMDDIILERMILLRLIWSA